MTDPLEILGGADVPVAPDREFTTRLRARIERALHLPRGVTVSDLDVLHPELSEARAPGRPSGPLTPYLAVSDAERAITFYAELLGAVVSDGPIVMPDGRIGHVELTLPGGARIMMADEYPEIGVAAPVAGAGAAVTLHLEVDDVDDVAARCFDSGGSIDRPPADNPYGRAAVVLDPFGHRWMLMTPSSVGSSVVAGSVARPGRPDRAAGDVGYASLWVDDVDAAAAFFADVIGWTYEPMDAAHPRGRHVVDQAVSLGLQGGVAHSTLFCCYAVADIDAALDRVTAAGGTASTPDDAPYGRTAMCADNQGTRFALFEPPAGVAHDLPEVPSREGDLAYVTHQVADAAAFRSFYAAVLDWRFTPGHTPDGWQIEGTTPSAGVSGGHPEARTIPFYAVDDIDAALARVRAAGGDHEDPYTQPYGTSALCSDGRGASFWLGQLT